MPRTVQALFSIRARAAGRLAGVLAGNTPWRALAGLVAAAALAVATAPDLEPNDESRAVPGRANQAMQAADDVDLRLLQAVRVDQGTAVVLGWAPGAPGTAFLVQRSALDSGPWATVATVTEPTWTDQPLTAPAWYRVVPRVAGVPRVASAPLSVQPVAAWSYEQTAPEGRLSALVRMPATHGPAALPLILVIHGTHGTCRAPDGRDVCPMQDQCPPGSISTPSAEGFVALAETLAARGYVVASLDANALGCPAPEIAIHGRVGLLTGHLRAWFAQRIGTAHGVTVDPTRVGLLGHSTGGEAVALMPETLARSVEPWAKGVHVRSIVAIAPIDLLRADPRGAALAVLLPACDMDDSGWSGRGLYDRAVATPNAPRAQWLLVGADHASFNAQWQSDARQAGFETCAIGASLGGVAQRAVLTAASGEWFDATLDSPGQELPPWLRGQALVPRSVVHAAGRPLDLRVSYAAAHRLDLDGKAPETVGFDAAAPCHGLACSPEFGAEANALRLQWRQGSPSVAWNLEGLDTRRITHVDLRMIACLGTAAAAGDLHYRLRLRDTAGHVAEVASSFLLPLHPPWTGVQDRGWQHYRRELPTTVSAALELFLAVTPQLQVEHLRSLELVLDGPPGTVLVTQVGLALP